MRQPEPGHERERLHAAQRLFGRPGVDGRQRPVVAAGHRAEHVQRLGAADLADDDPVGPHPQRVAHEAADRHLAAALQRRGPRLQPHDVGVAQAQLGGVLDGDDPLAVADELRQRVERRRLARAGAAADEDVAARPHGARQQVAQRRRPGPVGDELVGAEAAPAEAADREDRPVERERRDDDVDARAVRQAGIDERLGLVDAAPERREDALDRVAQVGLAVEAGRRSARCGRARSTHTCPGPLTMTSSTVASASSASSGPSPNERSAMRAASRSRAVAVEQPGLAVDERADAVVDIAAGRGLGEQPLAQRAGQLLERLVAVHALHSRRAAGIRPPSSGGSPGRIVASSIALYRSRSERCADPDRSLHAR